MARQRKGLLGLFSVVLAFSMIIMIAAAFERSPVSAEGGAVYTVNDVLDDNLFVDPGFEALTPENYEIDKPWDIYCAKQDGEDKIAVNSQIIIKDDEKTAYDGNSYLSINTGGWTGIAQKVYLEPGDYRLSLFAKGLQKDLNGEYNILNFSAFYNDGSGDIGYYESDTISTSVGKTEITESWQQFSRIFRVDIAQTFVVRIGVNGSATVALDHFSLEKLAYAQDTDGEDLFINGNMELNASDEQAAGDPKGWNFYGEQHGRDFADKAGSNARNNNSYFGNANLWLAMDIAEGGADSELRAAYQEVAVEENTTYKVSAFVRNWGIPESGFMIGMQTLQDGNWTDVSVATIPASEFTVPHKNVSAYFTTGAGITSVRFYLGGQAAVQEGAGYSFDEVTLKKVSDLASVSVTLPENVSAGSYAQAQATVSFANENTGFDSAAYTIAWQSSDTAVATIGNDGRISALQSGTTEITATVTSNVTGESKTDTKTLNVAASADLASLTVKGEEKVMLDAEGELTLEALTSDGSVAAITANMVSCATSEEGIVSLTVADGGKVRVEPLKAGKTTVTVTVTRNEKSVSDTFDLEVVTLSEIEIVMDDDMMQTTTQTVTVNAVLTDGTEISGVTAEFAIEEETENAPTVDGSGVITAGSATGEFTLNATVNLYGTEKTASQKFTVSELSELETVELSLDLNEIAAGERAYPSVVAKTASGTVINLDNAEVSYTIADKNVAKETTSSGQVVFFAVGAGETEITATVVFNGQTVTSAPVLLTVTGNLLRDGGFETNYAGADGNTNDYWKGEASDGAVKENFGYDIGGFGRTGVGNIFVRMPNSSTEGDPALTYKGTVRIWQDLELEADAYTLGAYIKRFPGEEGSGKFGGDVWFEAVLLDAEGNETETKFISDKNNDAGIGQFDALTFSFDIETAEVYRIYIVAQADPTDNTGIGFQMDDVSLIQGKVPSRISVTFGDKEDGDYTLKVNETATINVKALYDDGSEAQAENIRLSFSVDDGEIATVSKDGMVFALEVGETTIKITADVDGVSIVRTITLIVEDEGGSEPVSPEPDDNGWTWQWAAIFVPVGLVVVAGAVVAIVLMKKKNK